MTAKKLADAKARRKLREANWNQPLRFEIRYMKAGDKPGKGSYTRNIYKDDKKAVRKQQLEANVQKWTEDGMTFRRWKEMGLGAYYNDPLHYPAWVAIPILEPAENEWGPVHP